MTEKEKKQKVQSIIVVSAVIFALLMIVALVSNIITLSITNARVNSLEAELVYLEETIENNSAEISYRQTEEYIEDYAREYLNMKEEGEIIFIGK